MKNYRISFDYSAETPREALIYLVGIIEDPAMQEMPLDWLVTDLESGEEHKIRCSLKELGAESEGMLKKWREELGKESYVLLRPISLTASSASAASFVQDSASAFRP
jgi:hypothetical protein